MIISRAAAVFNQRGYFGTSIADLVDATGLERGGIYNHFANKQELALAAFEYAASIRGKRLQQQFQDTPHAADRLIAVAANFLELLDNPELVGGCPVLNTAVEADDALPDLKASAQLAMTKLRQIVIDVVAEGQQSREIRPEVDGHTTATIMLSMLEGALMTSKLYDDTRYLQQAITFLTQYIKRELRA